MCLSRDLPAECPPRGAPLGDGSLEGPVVTCPWHGWEFDVTTGACQTNPSVRHPCLPVQVQGSEHIIEV